MDATVEFIESVNRPEGEVSVERLALLIACHARPELDLEARLSEFDELAAVVDHGDLDSLRILLFGRLGFIGNTGDYYDSDNSMLDQVLSRRTGIPISLSILTMAVGRRCGVDLVGIGLPGHFLLRSVPDPELFIDPFGGGRLLDRSGCVELFRRGHGTDLDLRPEHLAPVGTLAIIERMLGNLLAIHRSRGDAPSQLWVARLRAGLPMASVLQRAEVAVALANCGRFDAAAEHFDRLAAGADRETAASLRAARDRMRSLMN